jgi:hypothetical protein
VDIGDGVGDGAGGGDGAWVRKPEVAFLKKSSAKAFCPGGMGVFKGTGFGAKVFWRIFTKKRPLS